MTLLKQQRKTYWPIKLISNRGNVFEELQINLHNFKGFFYLSLYALTTINASVRSTRDLICWH